jgi:hypothetical protein
VELKIPTQQQRVPTAVHPCKLRTAQTRKTGTTPDIKVDMNKENIQEETTASDY